MNACNCGSGGQARELVFLVAAREMAVEEHARIELQNPVGSKFVPFDIASSARTIDCSHCTVPKVSATRPNLIN